MPPSPPRWLTALTKTLSEHDKVSAYQIATVDAALRPHVRTHIHRETLVPKSAPAHPLLLTSTDVRTPKVAQMTQNGAVEVVWWIAPAQEQFRFSGRATVVPAPGQQPLHGQALATLASTAALQAQGVVDWEAKRVATFDAMGATMRASWARPTPGSKMGGSGGYDEAEKWPQKLPTLEEAENEDERKQVLFALGNFALVLIEPTDVDWVEMSVVPNRRTRFVKGEDGQWTETILVP